jgi:hypothetical protein
MAQLIPVDHDPFGAAPAQPGRPQNQYSGAISSIESGGNYQAVGPQTGKGRALGKYQVMDFNVGPWTQEALGRQMNPQEFLSSPDAQEAVFNHKFGGYVNKYGPEGAARAWFAGEGGMDNPNAKDILGTTVADYARKFNGGMSSQARQPQQAQPSQPKLIPVDHDPFAQQAQTAPQQPPHWSEVEPEGPPQAPASVAQKVAEPITSYLPTQAKMAQESVDQIGRGASQLQTAMKGEDVMGYPVAPGEQAANVAYGLGNAAMGGIGYLASPINAALRTVAGKPIEENTGIPKEYTEAALGFMLPVPGNNMASLRSVQTARPLTAGERVAQAGVNLSGIGHSGPVQVPKAAVSDSMATQRVGATVANVPVAGNPLVEAAGNTTKQLAAKSQDIAREYGAGSSITGGDAAATAIKDYISVKSKDSVNKLYDAVDSLVDPQKTTYIHDTLKTWYGIKSKREAAALPPGKVVGMLDEATLRPGMTYEGIKTLRTNIGEMLKGSILPEGVSQGELKQVYGALSKDLRAAVENAGGPKALAAFERANKYKSLVSDRNEALAKIVGTNGEASAAQVFDRLVGMAGNTTRADMSKLAQARKAMGGDAWNEVASGLISQMGRVEDATGNVIFSPQRFLTAYQTKLSEPGRAMLFRSAGKQNVAPFLDDIATISGRFRELQRFSNPSGTGQTAAGFTGMAGMALDPITTIGTGIGMNLVARMLATPATVAPAAQWSKSYEVVLRAPTPANVAKLTIASRNLANSINAEFGAAVQWQDLIRAAQGPVKGRAEDEQPKPEGVVNQ